MYLLFHSFACFGIEYFPSLRFHGPDISSSGGNILKGKELTIPAFYKTFKHPEILQTKSMAFDVLAEKRFLS